MKSILGFEWKIRTKYVPHKDHAGGQVTTALNPTYGFIPKG
jgi:hypothetical protein